MDAGLTVIGSWSDRRPLFRSLLPNDIAPLVSWLFVYVTWMKRTETKQTLNAPGSYLWAFRSSGGQSFPSAVLRCLANSSTIWGGTWCTFLSGMERNWSTDFAASTLLPSRSFAASPIHFTSNLTRCRVYHWVRSLLFQIKQLFFFCFSQFFILHQS